MNNLYPRTTSRSKSLLFMNQDLSKLLTQLTLNAVRLHLHFFKQPLLRTKATALGFLRTDRPQDHDRDDAVSDKAGPGAGENFATGEVEGIDTTFDSNAFDGAGRLDATVDANYLVEAGGIDAVAGPSPLSLPHVAAHPPLSFNPIRAPAPRR